MLGPFVVAPFVGVLLDRWRRRQVLLYANLIRGGLTLLAAIAMFSFGGTWVAAGLGLVALAFNRFILSGLSAGLPSVLDEDLLLTANSYIPTLGSAAFSIGGGLGIGLGLFLPPGTVRNGAALLGAAVMMTVAGLVATRLGRDQLGPEHLHKGDWSTIIHTVGSDLKTGARYMIARVTPGQGLLAMAAHRFLYGIVTIASILMARNLLSSPTDSAGGMGVFAVIGIAIVIGGAVAVLITPVLSRKTGPQVWVGLMMLFAAASQVFLAASYARWVVFLTAGLLGMAAQAGKIAVDTIVLRDTHDDFRGRAFSFYDLFFNVAYTGSAVIAAFIVPDIGWSRPLFLALAAAYTVIAILVLTRAARQPREVDPTLYA
jgi:MFS family permease